MSSIPASNLVAVNPQVIAAGSAALSLNGVFLTDTQLVPVGEVKGFATAKAVGAFFGLDSKEKSVADVYFKGFDGSSIKPSIIYFYTYVVAGEGGSAGYLRGGSIKGMTLADLQDLSGDLTISIDGDLITEPVDLAAATSFSNAATIIGTALDVAVEYDTIVNGFKITSPTVGAESSVFFASGALAESLKLAVGQGGYFSLGSDGFTLLEVMDDVTTITQNFATFTTTFEPDADGKDALATWTNNSNRRYAYIAWDTDSNAVVSGASSSFGTRLAENEWNGVHPIYSPNEFDALLIAAFVMGAGASIDFSQTNGRITFAYKGNSGIEPTVTTAVDAENLLANGYNFYGQYATASQQFKMLQNGSVSGEWRWLDTYLNQIYFNSRLQQRLLEMLTSVQSLPYNTDGNTIIRATCMTPINEMLNFGGIRTGIPLDLDQVAKVNSQAGVKIDDTLTNLGYYIQILPASATVRGNRQTPPIKIWYTDGGSIQQLALDSIDVM